MRIPKRRSEDYRKLKQQTDNHISKSVLINIKNTLRKLKNIKRPIAIQEVQRTQEMGDLSENAGYQTAKWKLRRINNKILFLKDKIAHAEIINPINNKTIQIGSKVTFSINKKTVSYTILGSMESDPSKEKISFSSPLGSKLLDAKINDELVFNNKKIKILKIEI